MFAWALYRPERARVAWHHPGMSALECKLCGDDAGIDRSEMCVACRRNLGAHELPPPRRPPAPCGKCSGWRFVRVVPRVSSGNDDVAIRPHPMHLTLAVSPPEGAFAPQTPIPTMRAAHGALETYVCTACGSVEWYCPDPTSIPIGPEYMSDLVDFTPATPAAPYR